MSLTKKLEEAESAQLGEQIKIYESIILSQIADISDEEVRSKEQAVNKLSQIYIDKGLSDELIQLQKSILPAFIDMPKSKQAKIVRTLFDSTMKMEGVRQESLVELCSFIIEWSERESRSFLRMRIQNKLAEIYFNLEKYNDSIEILKNLLSELKKKEDKQLLVEAQLVESKVFHALENLPKAKAALTSVKTTANAIYVVPLLQAEIDVMSGLIAVDEKDYTTSYSYFYEAFEGYRSMGEHRLAGQAFKYMLFGKIMNKQPDDAINLINSSVSLKYQGTKDLDAMRDVAQASKQRNLLLFEKCKENYQKELMTNAVIKRHFNYLYNNLLEDNLKKIILPYSEVQIDHVANQIGLPFDRVLQKLSEMILDQKIDGTLDQGRNCLIIFDEVENSEIFEHSLTTFKNLDGVLDSLYEKTQKFKQKYYN